MSNVSSKSDRGNRFSRREALTGAVATMASVAIVPRSVLGGVGHTAPSDKPILAGIGIGGVGHGQIQSIGKQPGTKITVLCDVDDRYAARTYKVFPKARRYRDFREMLQTEGTDAIELSGGTTYAIRIGQVENSWGPTKKKSVYWQKAAELYKAKVNVPLMLVGGIRSFETATELVEESVADYVSLCRPFIREPDLVNRWKSGDLRKAACVSDNLCGYESMKGKGLHCVHLK